MLLCAMRRGRGKHVKLLKIRSDQYLPIKLIVLKNASWTSNVHMEPFWSDEVCRNVGTQSEVRNELLKEIDKRETYVYGSTTNFRERIHPNLSSCSLQDLLMPEKPIRS